MTTRCIAANLAKTIAASDWVPEGIEAQRVYMDALTEDVEIGGHPTLVVVPRNTVQLTKKDPVHTMEVVLAVDASWHHSNPAAHSETPDGVTVFGSGALLDELVERLVNIIRDAEPGALLDDISIEYSLDSLPIQYAVLTINYSEISVWGD